MAINLFGNIKIIEGSKADTVQWACVTQGSGRRVMRVMRSFGQQVREPPGFKGRKCEVQINNNEQKEAIPKGRRDSDRACLVADSYAVTPLTPSASIFLTSTPARDSLSLCVSFYYYVRAGAAPSTKKKKERIENCILLFDLGC